LSIFWKERILFYKIEFASGEFTKISHKWGPVQLPKGSHHKIKPGAAGIKHDPTEPLALGENRYISAG
jgi:hypothetical protein